MDGLFPGLLGVRFVSVAKERIVAELQRAQRTSGCCPGARTAALRMAFADTLGAHGTFINLPEGATTTTLESKTSSFAAGREGSVPRGEATPRTSAAARWCGRRGSPRATRSSRLVTQTQTALPPRDVYGFLIYSRGRRPHTAVRGCVFLLRALRAELLREPIKPSANER